MANLFTSLILDVENMDRSLQFYHDLLDLPIRHVENYDGFRLAYLSTGQTDLLLVQQPTPESGTFLDRTGGQVMNFKVKNLADIASNLEMHNVKVLRGLEMAVWGERTFLVADPDGYAVLLSEPMATLH
jgi:predicted enzyme related to lactoylglutathione lyase